MTIFDEPAAALNLLIFLFSVWGFILFSWWWVKQGKASGMFSYVTLLFAGQILNSGMFVLSEHQRLFVSEAAHRAVQEGAFWDMRSIGVLVATGFIVVSMTGRIIRRDRFDENRKDSDHEQGPQ